MSLLPVDEIPLTGWLPDETLFSWCSRYHRMSGHRSSESTTLILLGHRRPGGTPHFPCGIDGLSQRTHGVLGTTQQIITARTTAPYFLPWYPPALIDTVIRQMRSPLKRSLRSSLGLYANHFRTDNPLRHCPTCFEEDRIAHGTGYWHRSHQLPGVLVCSRHHIWLSETSPPPVGAQRHDWLLPKPVTNGADQPVPTPQQLGRLLSLANASQSLLQLPAGWRFELHEVAATLLQRLIDLEMAQPSGRLHSEIIGQAFHSFAQPLLEISALQSIAPDESSAVALACGYFQRVPRVAHPLHHLLMILWLFGDWYTFMQAYQARGTQTRPTTSVAHACRPGAPGKSTNDQLHQPAGDQRQQMIDALLQGATKTQVAQQFGLTFAALTRFMQSEPGLHDQWNQNRQGQARTAARNRWSDLVQRNPSAPLKLLVFIEPGAYAWLYRNDRDWLTLSNKSRQPPRHQSSTHVSAELDQQLVSLVNDAAVLLLEQSPHGRLKLQELLQRVPQLTPHIDHLDQLPRTAQALTRLPARLAQSGDDLLTGI